ncbi:NapC/NirT family cytochrome c [Vibrio sp. M60_M31a]
MNYSSTGGFCFGCHIGMDAIVEEYQASIHYNNSKGVIAATCSDCHVRESLFPK